MKLRVVKDQDILFDLALLAFSLWLLFTVFQGFNGKYDCPMAKIYSYREDKIQFFCKEGRR